MRDLGLIISLFLFLAVARGDVTEKHLARQVIPLSNCANLTEEGATYVLQGDIIHSSLPLTSYCFQISSPSITLDGNGSLVILPFSDNYGCISVAGENATIQNITLQCSTGLSISSAGARVLNANVYFKITGIYILGDLASIYGCCAQFGTHNSASNCPSEPATHKREQRSPDVALESVRAMVGPARTYNAVRSVTVFMELGSPIGIFVSASGVSVTQSFVFDCAGGFTTQGNAGRTIGIMVYRAEDTQITYNHVMNTAGASGTDGGGDGIGILVQVSRNITIYGNIIDTVQGGSVSPLSSTGATGGDAVGIQVLSSSASVSSNLIAYISAGNGGYRNTSAGGDGGSALAIEVSLSFITSIFNNNVMEITGGNGGNSSYSSGGDGGNATGIWVDQGECLTIFGNNIGDLYPGIGGPSAIFPFVQNGHKLNLNIPTNLTCQITKLQLEAPKTVNASDMIAISVTTFIYNFNLYNFVEMCHFTTNDSTAQINMPADQGLPRGFIQFFASFSDPGIVSVQVTCNGTSGEIFIVVLAVPPSKPPPVTFSRYGRNYLEVNWQANCTEGTKCDLYFSSNQKLWFNCTLAADSSSYVLSNLEAGTTYYFYITLSDSNGVSEPSDISSFTTAAIYCGDGICDSYENCTNCYFDCSSECGNSDCLFACSENSTCVGGSCQCAPSMYGPSCSNSTSTTDISVLLDNSTIVISQLASSTFFYIILQDVCEVDEHDNIVAPIFRFDELSYTSTTNISGNFSEFKVIFSLSNNASVILTTQLSTVAYQTSFGGIEITIPSGVVKLWITIENWQFTNISNSLEVRIDSKTSGKFAVTKWEDAGNNVLWSQLTLETCSLYVTYNSYALLDRNLQKVKFSMANDSSILLQIPHFWNTAEIDPSYSLLLALPTTTGKTGANPTKGEKKGALVKPVVIIPIVVAIVVIALVAVIVKWVAVRLRKKREKSQLHSKARVASQPIVISDSTE